MPSIARRPAVWIAMAWIVVIGFVVGRVVTGDPTTAQATLPPSFSQAAGEAEADTPSADATETATPSPSPSPTRTTAPTATPSVAPTDVPTEAPAPAPPTAAPTPPPPTPAPPTPAPPPVVAGVLVGAGDIAECNGSGDEATAALLDSIGGTVFTAGDNVYPDGTLAEFNNCFNPSWGRHKGRMAPAPGNHDYHLSGASGYDTYFGNADGGPAFYYAYEVGGWRIYSLNSEVMSNAEVAWLQGDLAANPRQCVMAYWHHPLFSSGFHGNDGGVKPLWDVLYAAGAELVVNGHDHSYERFAPQTPAGAAAANGIREIVVGTGGANLRPFERVQANSEVRDFSTYGVLKLTLSPGAYQWEFVPAGGGFRDSGSGTCH